MKMLKNILVMGLICLGCKRSDSDHDLHSFFGMQSAKIRYIQQQADAPRFVALAEWFDAQILTSQPVHDSQIRDRVIASSLDAARQNIPNAYLDSIDRYVASQLHRIERMLAASSAVGAESDMLLRTTLNEEADQMLDIIRLILIDDPNLRPNTTDELAHFIHRTRAVSDDIESYAETYLQAISSDRDRRSLAAILNGLEGESQRFAAALASYYLTKVDRSVLVNELHTARDSLLGLRASLQPSGLRLQQLQQVSNGTVSGPVASLLHFQNFFFQQRQQNYAQDVRSGLKPGGDDGPRALSLLEDDEGHSGTIAAAPVLSTTPTHSQTPIPTGVNSTQPPASGGWLDLIQQLLPPEWAQAIFQLQASSDVQETTGAETAQSALELVPSSGQCDGLTGGEWLLCERFAPLAVVPDDAQSAVHDNWIHAPRFALQSGKRRGNFRFVRALSRHFRAKNQGRQPACTAYGTANSIEPQVQSDIDGQKIWQQQGRDMMLTSAIRTAKALYPQHNIQSTQLQNVSQIIQYLDQNQPVAASVPLGSGWYGGQGNTASGVSNVVTCRAGGGRHIISLQGYIESEGKLYFLIKNSWGPRWGDKGFAMLDWSTCGKLMQRTFAIKAGQ